MKRRDLIRHRVDHACELIREDGRHSWWGRAGGTRRSAVPRHREIDERLVKKIRRDLEIAEP
ncbi:MAG: type II toxin-antitoxin system HicA family toxin [Planctomycetota bacterium]